MVLLYSKNTYRRNSFMKLENDLIKSDIVFVKNRLMVLRKTYHLLVVKVVICKYYKRPGHFRQ